MILLDTNVVSELARPVPDPQVVKWLDTLEPAETWISAITVAEMKLGIALLPEGARKKQLAERCEATIEAFGGVCVAFDALCADDYAAIVSARRKQGRPIGPADAFIAAIARSAGLTLATRNTKDFSDIEGLTVIDPWGHR